MNQLKKYRLLFSAFFLIQILFIFILRYAVTKYCINSISINLLFFALLVVSVIPYLFYFLYCLQQSKIEKHSNVSISNVGVEKASSVHVDVSVRKNNIAGIANAFIQIEKIVPAFEKLFSLLAKEYEVGQGVAFLQSNDSERFEVVASYAFFKDNLPYGFEKGEGITGQVAKTGQFISICDIPENYIKIISGLGQATPVQILIFPVIIENTCIAVIEIAFFRKVDSEDILLINELIVSIASHIQKLRTNNDLQ